MKIAYNLNYKEWNEIGGKGGYILRSFRFETKKELKEYIKKELKDEDVILSIIEVKTKRLNVEDFK